MKKSYHIVTNFTTAKKSYCRMATSYLKVVPRVMTSLATFAKKSCHVAATSLVEIAQKSPPRGTTSLQMWQKKSPPRHTTSLQMWQNKSPPRVTTSLFFISFFFSEPWISMQCRGEVLHFESPDVYFNCC